MTFSMRLNANSCDLIKHQALGIMEGVHIFAWPCCSLAHSIIYRDLNPLKNSQRLFYYSFSSCGNAPS